MNFGLIYDFRNPAPWRRPFPELYQGVLEQVALAERWGFASVWISEHHFVEDGYCPSPLAVAAAMAARTSRIRIGTAILLLTLHHPVKVAEDAAVVDILSQGRLNLGLGRGYRQEEFQGYGVRQRAKVSLFQESLEILIKCWGKGPFSFDGAHYQIGNLDVHPKPVQRPHPPIFLGARSDAATRRVARTPYPLLLMGGRRQYQVYARALEEEVRPLPANGLVVGHAVVAAKDPEEARSTLRPYLEYRRAYYQRWGATVPPINAGAPNQAPLREPQREVFIGEPEACVREIKALAADIPIHTLVLPGLYPGQSPEEALEYLEIFAREVMPHFQGVPAQ